MNNFIRKFVYPFVCSAAAAIILGCGGSTQQPTVAITATPTPSPTPTPVTITSASVFNAGMIGQDWTPRISARIADAIEMARRIYDRMASDFPKRS